MWFQNNLNISCFFFPVNHKQTKTVLRTHCTYNTQLPALITLRINCKQDHYLAHSITQSWSSCCSGPFIHCITFIASINPFFSTMHPFQSHLKHSEKHCISKPQVYKQHTIQACLYYKSSSDCRARVQYCQCKY